MAERIASLAQYARRCGAQGILYTCSAFGDAIERVQRAESIPVLKPNEAMSALKAGNGAEHDRLLAIGAKRLEGCDAVMLAHFSTARAEKAVQGVLDCPVLTAPASAVRAMRARIDAS